MAWFVQLLSIAQNTFREAIRQPACFIIILVGGVAIFMQLYLSAFTFEDDNLLMINAGVSLITMMGMILAAFTASDVITREIDHKTALTIISKSVPKPIFYIGKFLGVLMSMSIAMVVWSCVLLLIIRHEVMMSATSPVDYPVIVFGVGFTALSILIAGWTNYAYSWSFGSTLVRCLLVGMPLAVLCTYCFTKDWTPQLPYHDFNLPIYMIIFLSWLAVLLLTSFAVAASTRLNKIGTLIFCLVVYLIGYTSDYILLSGILDQIYINKSVASFIHHFVPNLMHFWAGDAVADTSLDVTADADLKKLVMLLLRVSAFTILYTLATCSFGVVLFQRREIS